MKKYSSSANSVTRATCQGVLWGRSPKGEALSSQSEDRSGRWKKS